MVDETTTPNSPAYESVYGGGQKKEPVQPKPSPSPPPSSAYQSHAGTSRLDQPPEKSRVQKFREGLSSAGQRIKSAVSFVKQSKPAQYAGKVGLRGKEAYQKHVSKPIKGFGKEIITEAKTGFREGKEETKKSILGTVRGGIRGATSLPRIGQAVRERAETVRQRMREGRGIDWGGGLLPRYESGGGGTRAGQPRSLFGQTLGYEPRQRGTGRFKGAGSGLRIQLRYGGMRSPSGMGRMPRSPIPHGSIKPYWSKKLKKLARTNIRRFGVDDGLARTRQIAELAGWKMQ